VRACGLLRATFEYGTIESILETGVHEFIDDLQSKLNTLGNDIFETYVLYADLTARSGRATSSPLDPLAARHAAQDLHMQQQQQQQVVVLCR